MKSINKNEIPIFFATDNNYAPFLAVTLKSLLENSSKEYFYKVYILTSVIHPDLKTKINNVLTENSSIDYICVNDELAKIKNKLHLRDYYSMETYYRFFIPNMFPQYDKVIYLDCDIIVKGDISEFYNTDIKDNLVAAVQDQVFNNYDCFGTYAEEVLDIDRKNVFNAGVLLMNSKLFRKFNVLGQFVDLLSVYKFRVTQDEDYLNVICKDKVKYLSIGWNYMPFQESAFDEKELKLIHYNLTLKPWHYDNIRYQEEFWKYAEQTDFNEDIKLQLKYYSDEKKQKDDIAFEKLKEIAISDTNNPDNFKHICEREALGLSEKKKYFIVNSLQKKSLSKIQLNKGNKN